VAYQKVERALPGNVHSSDVSAVVLVRDDVDDDDIIIITVIWCP